MHKKALHVGSIIKLRPEFEERYIILHKHTFSGVLKRIRKSNIRNYSIFLNNGVLFSYLEYVGSNYDADMKLMGTDEATREWWKLTDPMQESLAPSQRGQWWVGLRLIANVEGSLKRSRKIHRFCFSADARPEGVFAIQKLLNRNDEFVPPNAKKSLDQNVSVFEGLGRVYLYVEQRGSELAVDDNDGKVKTVAGELGAAIVGHLHTGWKEMKEVFHTD